MKKFIVNSPYGEIFIMDRPNSHDHVKNDHLLLEALSKVDYYDLTGIIAIEVDMERCVGTSDCVELKDNDVIEWKYRFPRQYPSKMVHGREPISTNFITVVLKYVGIHKYVLLTAYVGPKAPRETYDPMATAEDIEFWRTHALRIECLNDNLK